MVDEKQTGNTCCYRTFQEVFMSTRLYVGNLSFNSTNDSIRNAFEQAGNVTDVHLVSDRDSGQSRGFAFVTMGSPAEATNAISQMNGALLEGRPLRVNVAEERQARGGGGGGGNRGGHRGWLSPDQRVRHAEKEDRRRSPLRFSFLKRTTSSSHPPGQKSRRDGHLHAGRPGVPNL
jgi:RNA recognition motif-containing protein